MKIRIQMLSGIKHHRNHLDDLHQVHRNLQMVAVEKNGNLVHQTG